MPPRANRIVLTERLIALVMSLGVIYGLSDLNGRAVVATVIVLFVTSFVAEHFRFRGLLSAEALST